METHLEFRDRLVHQLSQMDNWEMVEECDNALYVYDKLPDQLKTIFELKTHGLNTKEIAKKTKRPLSTVYRQVIEVKKRILRGENVI